jgi:phosphoserine phosphatase
MAILIANRLGFTGALGSKATIKDGKYTGTLEGNLLHGAEKAVAITKLAAERNFDLAQCYSYSDSHNDLPLLRAVGKPNAINPDAILQLRAMSEGWPIHEFRRGRKFSQMFGPLVSRLAAGLTWLRPPKSR